MTKKKKKVSVWNENVWKFSLSISVGDKNFETDQTRKRGTLNVEFSMRQRIEGVTSTEFS